jgi:hypothetical protein
MTALIVANQCTRRRQLDRDAASEQYSDRRPGRGPLRPPSGRLSLILRHRTKVTKGPGSKAAGLAMAFNLIEAAQARWRAVNAPHLVALVRTGARFDKGRLVERATTGPEAEATA